MSQGAVGVVNCQGSHSSFVSASSERAVRLVGMVSYQGSRSSWVSVLATSVGVASCHGSHYLMSILVAVRELEMCGWLDALLVGVVSCHGNLSSRICCCKHRDQLSRCDNSGCGFKTIAVMLAGVGVAS
jgi:hypothetical protein